jgi:PAS domain S-box-containing protein
LLNERDYIAKNKDELVKEIVELQSKLEEAEETLNAIQRGEIDAIVTQGPEESKVYTLEGSDYLYRIFVQEMSEGVATLTPDSTIFYSNAQLASLIQMPLEQIIGQKLKDFIIPDDFETFQTILDKGLEGKNKGEINIKSVDGTITPVLVSIKTLKDLKGVYAVITDLSEQKYHEELQNQRNELINLNQALQDSQDKYRNILENIQDGYIRTDKDGNIIMVSPSAARMYGYGSIQEMMGNSAISLYKNPEDRVSLLDEVNKDGKVEDYESKALRKDGTSFWVSLNVQFHYDDQGQIQGTEAFVRDITGRKKSEAELKRLFYTVEKERNRLYALINSINDEIWFADTNKKFTLANPSALQEFGIDFDNDLDIENFALSLEVFRPDGSIRPTSEAPSLRALKGEIIRNQEELIRTPAKNELRYRQVTASPVKDEKGNILGSVSVVRDITESKRADEALRESEERLRLAQTQGNVGVWDWNTVTDELSFTPELEHLYGLSPGTIKTYQDWRQLTHPDDIGKIEAERDDKIAKHEPFDLEFRIFHKSGDIRWLSAKGGAIYNKDGNVVRVLGINTDITERKQAEEQIKLRSEELAKSNADLKQFAYVASHDLREPLRMITTFLQLLERRYIDQLDEDAKEFIGFAVDGAKRLDNMIMDLLEYSRVANKEIQFTDVDLEEVIDQGMSNLNVLIEENSAQISYDSLPIISADENQMVVLLQNLISNAIKYRREETPQILVTSEKEGDKFVFSVKDNGIGIDPQHLDRIFTIFQRLHSHTEYEGSGIGLAIAQRIVHQHGGEIWAESVPGKGSTFNFTIPI